MNEMNGCTIPNERTVPYMLNVPSDTIYTPELTTESCIFSRLSNSTICN